MRAKRAEVENWDTGFFPEQSKKCEIVAECMERVLDGASEDRWARKKCQVICIEARFK